MRTARRLSSWTLALALLAVQLTPLDRAAYARMVASHRGKVVLVDFWATWCEQCREELPKLVAMARKLDASKFELITVSADEPEQSAAAAELLEKERVHAPWFIKQAEDDQVFIDSIDKQWSGGLPALFLYDRSGTRVASFFGEVEDAAVEAAVRKALR